MQTPLKGKVFVLIASAFEGVGLEALEKPFSLTAEYAGMSFYSLLIPNAGVSGDLSQREDVHSKVLRFSQRLTTNLAN